MEADASKFHFFWGGSFSQWAFWDIEVDDILYNTCEQYMMAMKAKLFNDDEVHDQIMNTNNPKNQKSLGRKVKNFDKGKWEDVSLDIVYKANYAKFTQHSDLREELLKTGSKIIAEASPYDCIWGIGLAESDSRVLDIGEWRGKNWLGEVLMLVRDDLILEDVEKRL